MISCVMATYPGRREFLAQALKYWERQTYPEKELVVVDDSDEPWPEKPEGVRRIEAPKGMSIGLKMNLGIGEAKGNFIQKMDDDDYYAPKFLETMIKTIAGSETSIASVGCCLIYLSHLDELKFSGYGMFFGNAFLFSKALWEKAKFRDLSLREDYWFLRDHNGAPHIRAVEPELVIVIRHGRGHLWTTYYGISTDAFFETRHRYNKTLGQVIPSEDLAFYKKLAAERRTQK